MATNKNKDTRGWYPYANHVEIPLVPHPDGRAGYPDMAPGSMEIKGVVHHVISGYSKTLVNWMKTNTGPQISCHFTIARDGEIWQHASIFDATWHAGNVEEKPKWELYTGISPNRITCGIEFEGFSKDPVSYGFDWLYTPSTPWPEQMIRSGIKITKWILEQHNLEANRNTIIGHHMLNSQNRAHDPGVMWPIDRMLEEINGFEKVERPNDTGQKEPGASVDTRGANLELAEEKLLAAIQLIRSASAD